MRSLMCCKAPANWPRSPLPDQSGSQYSMPAFRSLNPYSISIAGVRSVVAALVASPQSATDRCKLRIRTSTPVWLTAKSMRDRVLESAVGSHPAEIDAKFENQDQNITKGRATDDQKTCVNCGSNYRARFFALSKVGVDGRQAQCRGCVYADKQRRKRTITGEEEDDYLATQQPMCCKKCDTVLPVNFFTVSTSNTSGKLSHCSACQSDLDAARPQTPAANIPVEKGCSGPLCNGKVLPAASFTRCKLSLSGLRAYCKKCNTDYVRRNNRLAKSVPFGVAAGSELCCGSCREVKPIAEFSASSHRRSGRQMICKSCCNARNRFRYRAAKAQRACESDVRHTTFQRGQSQVKGHQQAQDTREIPWPSSWWQRASNAVLPL